MTILLLSLAIGGLLTKVVPTGVEPGTEYTAPIEADFQRLIIKRGLA